MAEEKLQYTLTLATKATGTGAKETAADMKAVAAATKEAEDAAKRFLTAEEAQRAEYDRLIAGAQRLKEEKRKLAEASSIEQRFLERTTESTRASYGAFYDLDAQIKKTNATTESFTGGTTQVTKSTRNASQSLLLFSQGFEDAQYGMRGVLNNIPGLVVALGGSAGLAGAISVAAVGTSILVDWLTKTEEKASDVAERIKTIASNVGATETDRLNDLAGGLEAAAEQAEALKQNYDLTRAAENGYATSALSNAAKIDEVHRGINELLGLQVDHHKELQDIADQEQAKRELAAQQAIDAEKEKGVKAEELVTRRADELQRAQQIRDVAAADLVIARAKMEALREQKKAMEELLKQPSVNYIATPSGPVPTEIPGMPQKQKDARRELASPEFTTEMQALAEKITVLEEEIYKYSQENTGKIAVAATKLQAANTALVDQQAAVEIGVAAIQQTLAADNLAARYNTTVELVQQNATDLQKAVQSMVPSLASGKAAKESILKATADGKITADEQKTLAANLTTLIGQLQAGTTTSNGNVNQLIQICMQFSTQNAAQANEIDRLWQEVRRVDARIQSAPSQR